MLALAGCSIDGLAIWADPGLADDESSEGDSDDGDDGIEGNDDESSLLDLPEGEGEQQAACMVTKGQLDAALPCDAAPTSTTLAPVVAWTWTGPSLEDSVIVTPLVANLDDDNANGAVDLCDVPDLVVIAVDLPASKNDPIPAGHIYVIDTETGETKLRFAHAVDGTATPALADLDDDGVPEILAFERSNNDLGDLHERRVIAFDAAGSVRWTSDTWVSSYGGGALAVADLDADGSPEILAPEHVLSADGALLWAPPDPPTADSLPVAADLDLDGELEVLFGRSVYAHDGQLLFDLELPGNHNAGLSAVANFDDDPEPEIYVHSVGHRIFEHDGTPKATCGGGNSSKQSPATIADLDGDGKAEILVTHGAWFRVATVVDDGIGKSCETLWGIKISDGIGSAFDFLGDGSAEAIYADLDWVRIFDDSNDHHPVFEYERKARPSMANPVVADADNDGAAELIIVASEPVGGDDGSARPSVIYIQNADDQFAPTRRIWNQHTYYATNVREDARVPVEQQDDWREGPNSFRANPDPSYDGQQCQEPIVP